MVFVPTSLTAGQNPLSLFNGLQEVYFLPPPPGTAFQIKCIFRHKRVPRSAQEAHDAAHTYPGPPLHFHAHQTERFLVVSGRMGIESNDERRVVTAEDGVVVVPANTIHKFWALPREEVELLDPGSGDSHDGVVDGALVNGDVHPAALGMSDGVAGAAKEDDEDTITDLVVLINATDSGQDFILDTTFFTNWYSLRHDLLVYDGSLDLFQTLCTFDAGDHYLPFPSYLPCFVPKPLSVWIRLTLGYWGTRIIGRYIAPALGYRPFFREYTADWEYAQARMDGSWFHARNVDRAWTVRRSFEELQGTMTVFSNKAAGAMDGAMQRLRGRYGERDSLVDELAVNKKQL